MDKLNIALKLIQLLNERKSITSKIVAEELNVSIRTAQRYLAELSMLPCVMNLNNNHTYAINSEYKLSEAISNCGTIETNQDPIPEQSDIRTITSGTCLFCANTRAGILNAHAFNNPNNLALINRLVSIIEKKLKLKKCGYSAIKPLLRH